MASYTLTNITPALRGIGLGDGTTLCLAAGATSQLVELTDAEKAEVERLGWFEVAPEAVPDEINLDSLTVDQLKAFAADSGIDLGEAKLKAEILAAIEAALAAPDA